MSDDGDGAAAKAAWGAIAGDGTEADAAQALSELEQPEVGARIKYVGKSQSCMLCDCHDDDDK